DEYLPLLAVQAGAATEAVPLLILVTYAGMSAGGLVADLGCGPGHDLVRLAERGLVVVGVDASSGMLARAAARAPGRLATGSCAGVWSSYALLHLDDAELQEALFAVARVLAPGGVAVLVLAGDIDVETAKEKVAKYFGHIPAGPSMAQPAVDIAERTESTREVMEDRVPQARIYRLWNVAQTGTRDIDQLQLLAQVLGRSASSRLDQRLVHGDKLADGVSAGAYASQLGSNFVITADVKQGVEPERVEAIIDEELERLLLDGPTDAELERARTDVRAGWVRGIEKVGGFGGKATVLAQCEVYQGDAGCFRETLDNLASATPADIQALGEQWLSAGDHTLVVVPGERTALPEDPAVTPAALELPPVDPDYSTLPTTVDRSEGVPQISEFPELSFPELQRATLDNGTEVILAERHDIPVVQMSYEFGGGFRADQGAALGTSSFTMSMLDEGAGEYGALEFGDRAESLGARLAAGAALDGGNAYLSALKSNLDESIDLFAEMLRNPRFDPAEIERVKATWIAGIKQEKARPNSAALRVLPPLLYGEGHAYAMPFSGSGTEESIAGLTRGDLLEYHADWVRPQDATLIVVGDTTLGEIVPLLNRHLGDWEGVGEPPQVRPVAQVERPEQPRVYLIDQPGAVQANLFVGQLMPPTGAPGETTLDMANEVIGGSFTARLNMNLREDKHWSYGARSILTNAQGQRPWLAVAPVQIDKTAESLAEIQREVSQYASGEAPPSDAELAKIQANEIRSLPGAYETASAVLGTIGGIVRYDRPDDYIARRTAQIESMTPAQIAAAAKAIDPNAFTWVVVGDLEQIEQPVRALNLGEVHVLDANGNPVVDDEPAAD
ncbi:MAG: insulinase family protein, partial [Proteobacteria bacterium]|nr:insulinase family protein [Pseudomonadota bacterium]